MNKDINLVEFFENGIKGINGHQFDALITGFQIRRYGKTNTLVELSKKYNLKIACHSPEWEKLVKTQFGIDTIFTSSKDQLEQLLKDGVKTLLVDEISFNDLSVIKAFNFHVVGVIGVSNKCNIL